MRRAWLVSNILIWQVLHVICLQVVALVSIWSLEGIPHCKQNDWWCFWFGASPVITYSPPCATSKTQCQQSHIEKIPDVWDLFPSDAIIRAGEPAKWRYIYCSNYNNNNNSNNTVLTGFELPRSQYWLEGTTKRESWPHIFGSQLSKCICFVHFYFLLINSFLNFTSQVIERVKGLQQEILPTEHLDV